MPFSGTTFTKLYNWLTDPQRNDKIFNSRLDDEFGGIATGLTTTATSLASTNASLASTAASLAALAALPSSFLGTFTRNISLTSALSITGVGFTPKVVLFMSTGVSSSKFGEIGFDNAVISPCLLTDFVGSTISQQTTQIIALDGSNFNRFTITSMDADGFTLGWTKTGTPTGTAAIYYVALR